MAATHKAAAKTQPAPVIVESDKNFVAALLISILFGSLGADRFYLGYVPTAVLKLFTAGGLGIWVLIDVVRIGLGELRDSRGLPLAGYAQNSAIVRKIILAYVTFVTIVFLIGLLVAIIFMTYGMSYR